MPNMEEPLNQSSVEITCDGMVHLFISKIDLDYAYGQMKLSEETSQRGVFAITGKNSGDTTDSKKSFAVLPNNPQYFNKNWPDTRM